jgi:hypothetical protein
MHKRDKAHLRNPRLLWFFANVLCPFYAYLYSIKLLVKFIFRSNKRYQLFADDTDDEKDDEDSESSEDSFDPDVCTVKGPDWFKCKCFHCKLNLSAFDPKLAEEKPKEHLTVKELIEKLTENWKRIEEIDSDDSKKEEVKNLINANEEFMDMLAMKKTYLPEGRYCTCRKCAFTAINIS